MANDLKEKWPCISLLFKVNLKVALPTQSIQSILFWPLLPDDLEAAGCQVHPIEHFPPPPYQSFPTLHVAYSNNSKRLRAQKVTSNCSPSLRIKPESQGVAWVGILKGWPELSGWYAVVE